MTLLDLLIVLLKQKKLILGLPFAVALIVAAYTLTMRSIYTASTKILPPQQSQSASASMLAQLGGLANLVGGPGGIGLKNPADFYIAMLKSRTVADNLIQRFGLMKLWQIDANHPSDAYKALDRVTNVSSGKDGLINIEVDDPDPKFAADLANAYVDELFKFTSGLALTEASQRRLFFERQFGLAKENLAKAETAARQALQTGGVVKVDDQGRAMVEATARLRAQMTLKEVQIGAMRSFASDNNPDLRREQQELESLKHELVKIEGMVPGKPAATGPAGQGMENLRLLRDVKYQEALVELLAKQYEMSRIDEAKDGSIIQVIDKAVQPDRKSKPWRSLIVVLWAFAAFVGTILWVVVREATARARSDPKQAARLQALERHLAWR